MLKDVFQRVAWGKLGLSLGFCYAAGLIGGGFTGPAVTAWYPGLAKPGFTPPSWVFGVVWPILYTLMGIALYIVWSRGTESRDVRRGLTLFAAHLVLNAGWSFAFFGLRSPALGLAVIMALIAVLAATMYYFREISERAFWLLVPYILWLGYAAVLNASIWMMN